MRIKIIYVPDGDSPYWVRKEMVSCELEVADEKTILAILKNMGAETEGLEYFYSVYIEEVRKAASARDLKDVVEWLKGIETPYGIFMIRKEYCQVLD